jgi:hypothetical protein
MIFENRGGGPTTFDVEFQTNVMSEDVWNGTGRPGIGYLPTATRSGITVGPGQTVEIKATDWLDLNNSLIVLGDEAVPGEVLDLVVEETGGQVQLSWSPPVNTGGWPITEYSIMRGNSIENMTEIGTSNSTTFIDEDAERGTTYYYSVRAVNALGAGDVIEPVTILIPALTAPEAPPNFSGQLVEGEIILEWDPPADDGGSEVTNYVLFKGSTSGDLTQLAELGNETAYTDSNIQSNMTYYYQVAAVNSIGQGILSDEIQVEVPADQPPPDDDDDDDDEDEEDDDESDNPWILFLIIGIVVVVIIIILLVFLSSRGKGEDYEE